VHAATRASSPTTSGSPEVEDALERHRPRAAIVNAGGARFNEGGVIVMDAEQVAQLAPRLPVAVVHLEAINHCLEPRSAYDGVLVPLDGETFEL
jgi:hypothetical protein